MGCLLLKDVRWLSVSSYIFTSERIGFRTILKKCDAGNPSTQVLPGDTPKASEPYAATFISAIR